MMRRTWSDALATGVPLVDREHEQILAVTDEFRSAVDLGRPADELRPLLDRVTAVVSSHFASEEELMRSSGYKGVEGHAAEHRRLLEQLQLVTTELASGGINPCGALALFVGVWVKQHIDGSDARFVEFLKTQTAV